MQSQHRSGPLKQKNKAHHTLGHKSNRKIKQRAGGKISHQSLSKKNKVFEWRQDRKNRENDLKKIKRQNAFNLKRSLGQLNNAPYIVTILYFGKTDETSNILRLLTNYDENDAIIKETITGSVLLTCSRLKLRFQFLLPDINNLLDCMDSAKISDVLLCVYDANLENEVDRLKNSTNSVLNAIYNNCLPTTIHVLHKFDQIPIKKQSIIKKTFVKHLDSMFPDEKIFTLDNNQEALTLLNMIGNCKKKSIAYREKRCQMFFDKIEFIESDNNTGSLKVEGFIRNKNLDVNKLIHIPSCGDFQIGKIEVLNDPFSVVKKKNQNEMDVENEVKRVFVRDSVDHEDLITENEVDEDFMDEQALLTAEDIARAEEEHLKKKKLVQKGTSDYQAAWLVDSDDDYNEEDSDYSDEENEDFEIDEEEVEDNEIESNNDVLEEDMESVITEQEYNEKKYDEKVDFNEEMNTLVKIKEEKMCEVYPDEIDTPLDKPAKLRFAKYRGLKSFHKSFWEPNENLPKDYSRIFQFQNFKKSRKIALENVELADGPEPGEYVRVEILNFDKSVFDKIKSKKILLFYQLLKHEQKMSLLNVVLRKHSAFSQPIKSKERLIFHVGCRRYSVCPIFSIHSNGDKHKYEKFLRSDTQMVASFYGPITFNPCSVSVYKQFEDGSQHLVATGSVLNNKPNRVVVKRLILSGYPFKIHKTVCVIRYMFFNRDDILWFKPIELRTKFGRKGNIKEPLGTHGHMKCVFDKTIKSNDTVLMNLYKRVFPKWTYEAGNY